MGYTFQRPSTGHHADHKMWVIQDYGYRYYDPGTGRWVSRDPIEEQGGVNLCAFLKNQSVNAIDRLGLEMIIIWVDSTDEIEDPQSADDGVAAYQKMLEQYKNNIVTIKNQLNRTDIKIVKYVFNVDAKTSKVVSKEEMVRLLDIEKSSKVVRQKEGGAAEFIRSVKEYSGSASENAKIVGRVHSWGSSWFPNGHKVDANNLATEFKNNASGRRSMFVGCGQETYIDPETNTQASYYERLHVGPTGWQFGVKDAKGNGRMPVYYELKRVGMEDGKKCIEVIFNSMVPYKSYATSSNGMPIKMLDLDGTSEDLTRPQSPP